MTDLHYLTAVQLAEKLRNREVGAVELLRHFQDRIERFNPALNAVIWQDAEDALAQAEAADAVLQRGETAGPLTGVPMTVKESYNISGAPQTWGNPLLKNNIPDTDGETVTRFKDAGAVVFGKTNVPIFLADWQSYNDIYGTTNNPWDLSRTPGGSSGGSAAALAAGLTGLEIGSDIGASIRNPAHYCGVFGHKPTWGIVPGAGHALPGQYHPIDITVCGPLARDSADLRLALDIMAGPEPINEGPWKLDLPGPRHRQLKDFRVAVMLNDVNAEVDQEYQDRLQSVADQLAQAGVSVSDSARPNVDTSAAMDLYVRLLRAATSARHGADEIERFQKDLNDPNLDARSYHKLMAEGALVRHRDWLGLSNERQLMRLAWAEFFKEWDILLCPAASSAAWPHDQEGERPDRTITVNNKLQATTDQLFWAGFSGMVYLPSTVSPIGVTTEGLPLGMQAIAGYGEDYTSIEFCRLCEHLIGGFTPPPGYS